MEQLRWYWAAQPTCARYFLLYLLIVSCMAIVRSIKLARQLHSVGGRRQVSLQAICDGRLTGEMLAESALANSIVLHAGKNNREQASSAHRLDESSVSDILQSADNRFAYL